MFVPNNIARHWVASPALDVYGERSFVGPTDVPCAVVSLNLEVGKTSVRADSSGSRGRAEEEQGIARILFPTFLKLTEKDVIEIAGKTLEVIQVTPRWSVAGKLDHFECDLRQSGPIQ